MEKTALLMFVFILIAIPLVNADVIMPGTHAVTINNQITNINDFPDYAFVSICKLGSYSQVKIVGSDGKIESYYKFCDVSVYAIPKSKFKGVEDMEYNFNKIVNESIYISGGDEIRENFNDTYYNEKTQEYFNSLSAKKVISGISSQKTLSDSDPTKEITEYYTIELNKNINQPNLITSIKQNYFIYLYVLVPVISLIIIIYIILKRKNK
ncbi:MAG: hypothetical protein Q7S33_04315 [Nanoarchaeota archaeon]|nr:hypothetical protein [Nanoarchaeota archaeon]